MWKAPRQSLHQDHGKPLAHKRPRHRRQVDSTLKRVGGLLRHGACSATGSGPCSATPSSFSHGRTCVMNRLGHRAVDWGRGLNKGPNGSVDSWLAELAAHVVGLMGDDHRSASLVGWRLGGLYARELGKRLSSRAPGDHHRHTVQRHGGAHQRRLALQRAEWQASAAGSRTDGSLAQTTAGAHDFHLQPKRRGRGVGRLVAHQAVGPRPQQLGAFPTASNGPLEWMQP